MEKKFRLIALSFVMAASVTLSSTGICAQSAVTTPNTSAPSATTVVKPAPTVDYKSVDPLDLVANPQNYLNQKIKFTAQFDKFSTIGLDYDPVKRSSKDYISFMIKRPDIVDKNYTIPLSELKLIIKRDKAEKLIDLESGNKIEVTGTVISAVLGDPWVDVDDVKILEAKKPATPKK